MLLGSPNFVRFVYDGDASDTDSLASTSSAVQGTDKGTALGHGDYNGSLLRK